MLIAVFFIAITNGAGIIIGSADSMKEFVGAVVPLVSSAAILQLLLGLYFQQLTIGMGAGMDGGFKEKSVLQRLMEINKSEQVRI